MSSFDKSRIAEIVVGRRAYSSGYRISNQLVLTAAHHFNTPGACTVWLGGKPQELGASLKWRGTGVDIALVQLDDPPDHVEPMSFGELPDDRGSLPFFSVGFPLFSILYETDRIKGLARRESKDIQGFVLLGSNIKSGLLDLQITSASPAEKQQVEDPDPWKGASGAVLFDQSGDHAIGVQTHRLTASGTASAVAEPLTRALEDPEFLKLIRREKIPERPIPVPLSAAHGDSFPAGTAITPQTSSPLPSGLQPLPPADGAFIGRKEELSKGLRHFQRGNVLPVHGPLYAGKTAFVNHLLSAPKVLKSVQGQKPWLHLKIRIINASAESAVLEALASALDVRRQDINAYAGTEGDPRHEAVIDRLRDHAGGHSLVVTIDCNRLGYNSKRISDELSQLLEHPYFADMAHIIISRVEFSLDRVEYLNLKLPVHLKELQRQEAVDLLVSLMGEEQITVNGNDVLSRVGDRRLWLPGVLINSAYDYLKSSDRTTDTPNPESVATALLEGTAASTAETLRELSCHLTSGDTPKPEPLAVLAVWALAERLPLREQVLKSSSVGFSDHLRRMLENTHLLFRDDSGFLTLGPTSEQALRSLLLAALTRDEPVDDPDVAPIVGSTNLDDLFPPELNPQEIDRRLSAAAESLLTAAGTQDAAESANDGSGATFQRMLRSALGWIEDEGGNRLPQLHKVFGTFVWANDSDAAYSPTSTDSLVQPAIEEVRTADGPGPANVPAVEEEATSLVWLYRLFQAGASLNVASRAEGPIVKTGERFVSVAEQFSSALANCDPEQVPHTLLRSVDASLTITVKKLGVGGRLLGVRLTAIDMLLLGARRLGPGQAGRITLAISWLLNTADNLIDADRLEEARKLVSTADALVTKELPHDGTARSAYSRHQISSRIARVRSRVLMDPEQSRQELLRAVRNIVAGLHLAHEQDQPLTLWTIRLFEFATLLMQHSSTDEELIETRELVLNALERSWGDRRDWPSSLCVVTSRFLRKVHVRCTTSELRRSGAEEAVDLLERLSVNIPDEAVGMTGTIHRPPPEAKSRVPSLNDQEDAKVLSALAQTYGFLSRTFRDNQSYDRARARLVKAEEFAYAAVLLSPTPFTYSVWLRQVIDMHRFTSHAESEENEKRRRACVKAVRVWLTRENSHSHSHALLDLTCLESDWAHEGSLRGASQKPGEDFLRLDPTESRSRVEELYRKRRKKLETHLHRYGPSIDLHSLEIQLEREYCRWRSVLDFKVAKQDKKRGLGPGPTTRVPKVDNTPIFTIFRKAEKLWPGEGRMIATEAAFHRYIWDYGKAIELYENLVRTAPNGEIRNSARLSAAEAMLADVEFATPVHRSNWHTRLIDAQEHVNAALSHDDRVGLALLLRERIAIRIGSPVNWEPIDAAFEAIVGGDYTGTVGRFLNWRHYEQKQKLGRIEDFLNGHLKGHSTQKGTDGTASDGTSNESLTLSTTGTFVRNEDPERITSNLLGESLIADFTNEQLLNGIGKLYLDRASDIIDRHRSALGSAPAPDSEIAVHAAGNARKAYDCFDACRIIQEAYGTESIVTKFERGRAITRAAKYLHDPNPFPLVLLNGQGPQVRQAVYLLLAARENSVSGFNSVCSQLVGENNALQESLGLRRPSWPAR